MNKITNYLKNTSAHSSRENIDELSQIKGVSKVLDQEQFEKSKL